MRNILSLLKIFIKVNFFFPKLRRGGFKKKERVTTFLFIFLLILVVGFLIFGYLFIIKYTYDLLINFNQSPDAIIALVMIIAQALIIIFGAIGVISVFYLSNDTERLIPLPIRPVEVIFARFISILMNQYMVMLPLVLSAFIYLGILKKASIGYWLKLPVIYMLLPVIPLAIVIILVMFLMRVVNFGKNKDKLIIIGAIFLMCLTALPQFLGNNAKKNDSNIKKEVIVKFLTSSDGLVQMIGNRFPPVLWATKGLTRGMTKEGVIGFVTYAGASILSFLFLLYIGKLIFYKSLIGIQETPTENKKKIDFSKIKFSDNSSHIIVIFKREFKEMNRTPMFFINGVVTSLFMPILMLLWISINKGGEQFQGLFNLFTKNNSDILVFIVIIVLYASGGINGTAASSISREGKNFWYSKTIPISYKDQIAGKYLHALGISIVGYIGGFIILFFILKINLFLIIKGTIPEFALITIGIAFSLLLDLRKPILDWENHRKAMKQNPNVVKSVLFMSGFVAISGFFIYKLIKNNYTNLNSLYYSLTFVLILMSVLINFYLFKNLKKSYSKIEV